MLREKTIVSSSPEETGALGVELSRQLEPGDLLAFIGDLGTGKTCMIQGVCKGLGVTGYVTSPTFILINEYAGRLDGRDIPVYHLDLYRLNTRAELEDLGVEEYFYGQGICLVEWAERAGELLPPRTWQVRLDYIAADQRRITLKPLIPAPRPFRTGQERDV